MADLVRYRKTFVDSDRSTHEVVFNPEKHTRRSYVYGFMERKRLQAHDKVRPSEMAMEMVALERRGYTRIVGGR